MGVFIESIFMARTRNGLLGLLVLIPGSAALVWSINDPDVDPTFRPVAWTFFFIFLFFCFYHDRFFPRISFQAVLHFTLLLGYWLWLNSEPAPQWIAAIAIILSVVPLYGLLFPKRAGASLKVTSYVTYILVTTALLVTQAMSVEHLLPQKN